MDLKNLQENILYIAKYFDSFCKEHEIEYFLLGGTALGAARHEGFIPWDDDFDVCMTFKNYQKFRKLAKTSLEKTEFYFQEENTDEWPLYFSKIRMNDTLYIEEDVRNREMHHGIYIDIMCLNNTFSNKLLRYTQFCCARLLSASALGRRGFITNSIFRKIAIKLLGLVLIKPIRNLLLNYVHILNSKKNNTEYLSHFFGRAKFKNTSYHSNLLGKERRVKFDNYMFPVMEFYENYLMKRFGDDYMKLPSEEVKAQYPSHCVEFKLSNRFERGTNDNH